MAFPLLRGPYCQRPDPPFRPGRPVPFLPTLPFAIVFGAIRGIPLFWRVVDPLFGIGGLVVLLVLRHHLSALGQPAPASARTASQFDGADSASPVFGFGAILILAGRAAHLEAVRPHPCHVHG